MNSSSQGERKEGREGGGKGEGCGQSVTFFVSPLYSLEGREGREGRGDELPRRRRAALCSLRKRGRGEKGEREGGRGADTTSSEKGKGKKKKKEKNGAVFARKSYAKKKKVGAFQSNATAERRKDAPPVTRPKEKEREKKPAVRRSSVFSPAHIVHRKKKKGEKKGALNCPRSTITREKKKRNTRIGPYRCVKNASTRGREKGGEKKKERAARASIIIRGDGGGRKIQKTSLFLEGGKRGRKERRGKRYGEKSSRLYEITSSFSGGGEGEGEEGAFYLYSG